jgi:ribonuclease BN (tRNA processing enzyme)/CheY-like chemotaxis protein
MKPCSGHILISHTHWDHIQGLPFFAPLFEADNEWHIYGPRGLGQSLREVLAGQMEYAYFPVTINAFAATVHFHEVVEGAIQIGDARISTQYLNHPALTVGYRIEADGALLVYASDHEPHSADAAQGRAPADDGADAAHIDFVRGADLLIHDAQYTAEEFPAKVGWGHSTVEYVTDVAIAGNVAHVSLFHHDPARSDRDMDDLVFTARARAKRAGSGLVITGAAEGETIELRGADPRRLAPFSPSGLVNPSDELSEASVLLSGVKMDDRLILTAAAEADDLPVLEENRPEALATAIQAERPSLVFLGDAAPGSDPIATCRTLRALLGADGRDLPIIVVTDQTRAAKEAGEAAGVTDWLTRPYSLQYARSRMRAWLMRAMSRWRKAPLPPDEDARLAAVHGLGLLDTEAEDRFDRHARLAAAALDMPIALVTLIDRDRQWYKSHIGFDFSETPRDIGFCSHAILGDAPLVVTDALQDDRFAENPAVVGDPRVRFYAGVPLKTADGARVGAVCVVDHKPRDLSPAQLRMLQDVARLLEEELRQPPDSTVAKIPRAPTGG